MKPPSRKPKPGFCLCPCRRIGIHLKTCRRNAKPRQPRAKRKSQVVPNDVAESVCRELRTLRKENATLRASLAVWESIQRNA